MANIDLAQLLEAGVHFEYCTLLTYIVNWNGISFLYSLYKKMIIYGGSYTTSS